MLNSIRGISDIWRKHKMKKYVTSLICCLLVVCLMPQVVNAGDQTNPEITDPEKDVLLFGQFMLPFVNRLLDHLDILSAWFSENPDEPDILYVTLQCQDVKPMRLMGIYGVVWFHNGLEQAVITLFKYGKENMSGVQLQESNITLIQNLYTIDTNEHTITWAIPKDVLGDLQPGDTLTQPVATSGLRFASDTLANLVKKRFGTNCIGFDFTEPGNDYVILY
jgi:hypothetical protein